MLCYSVLSARSHSFARTLCLLLPLFALTHTATPQIYTLSLHDALPISGSTASRPSGRSGRPARAAGLARRSRDRKSTRLNSSHLGISYAVFCLKKKKTKIIYKQKNKITLQKHIDE